ncbi:sigma 54-interacting transcriptional regulator [Niallia sp. 03190]|uniref:sigma 54-interacting transcriptional regulator n=1 Tax=Niallia sp. 03190 TaxID=3458061 RepID=UPI0040440C52
MQYSLQIDCIFNEIKQGIILVNKNGTIILLNEEAAKLIGSTKSNALGKHILEVVANSGLPRVLQTGKKEIGKGFVLASNCKVRISRIPLFNKQKQTIGAIAYFTNVWNDKEDWYDQENLQAIVEMLIQNTEAAISITDEKANSMMKNTAYSQLTENTNAVGDDKQSEIYSKLSESMHQKVLQTRRSQQIVKKNHQQSIKMDDFPVIIDGKLKGSMQIIQDQSHLLQLQNELKMARSFIRALEEKYIFDDIISDAPSMQLPLQQGKIACDTDCPVLIRGAAGTGKKMFASVIHHASNRKYNRFVVIPCINTSEKELESILFGTINGNDREETNTILQKEWNGTVYLDEISFLPIKLQQKLLQFLQSNDRIRIIAGSSENMEKSMIKGDFLEQLYYELNRISIHLPLLNNRKEDIPLLTKNFVQQLNHEYGRSISVELEVFQALEQYHFTSNVKELKAILQLSMAKMDKTETVLTKNNLCFAPQQPTKDKDLLFIEEEESVEDKPLSILVENYEKVIIEKALRKNDGNKTLTAKSLGLSVRNLYYKLEKYGLG